jgi:ribonuclease HII
MRSDGRLTLVELAAALRDGRLRPEDLADDPRAGVRRLAAQWARQRARLWDEQRRVVALFARERDAWRAGIAPVAGVDEAGRGPLAGPVVAAAVVFEAPHPIPRLKDSKKLRPTEREAVYEAIVAAASAIGLGIAEVDEIDRLNILGATRLAWCRAIAALGRPPALVLLDGNIPADLPVPQVTIVGGDEVCASIAAASVVAKVRRDRLMVELDRRYPVYGFARHKGYATREHLAAVRRFGPSPEHRRAFLPADLRRGSLGDF